MGTQSEMGYCTGGWRLPWSLFKPLEREWKVGFVCLIPRAYGVLCNNPPVSLEIECSTQMYFSVIRIFPFCALLNIWNSWKFTPYSFYTKNTNISQYFLFPKEAHRQFQLLHTPPYWLIFLKFHELVPLLFPVKLEDPILGPRLQNWTKLASLLWWSYTCSTSFWF